MTNDSTKLPPELTAYIDGLCDADPDGEEIRELLMPILGVFFETMKEVVASAVLLEREACAVEAYGVNDFDEGGIAAGIAIRIRARGSK